MAASEEERMSDARSRYRSFGPRLRPWLKTMCIKYLLLSYSTKFLLVLSSSTCKSTTSLSFSLPRWLLQWQISLLHFQGRMHGDRQRRRRPCSTAYPISHSLRAISWAAWPTGLQMERMAARAEEDASSTIVISEVIHLSFPLATTNGFI